jgi:folate-binding protein YgfZ
MSIILHSYKHDRGALEVSGDETDAFLNDILTAELGLLPAGKMQMSCLLSPQGRILHDMLIYRVRSDCYWIEVASTQIIDLKKRIAMYRLRKAITIDIIENWHSAHLYHQDGSAFLATQITQIKDDLNDNHLVFEDSRRPELGLHIIGKETNINAQNQSWKEVNLARWESLRIANMVPSGEIDLTPNRTLMLEASLDLFQAVDFQKGCYIGQEVTARTKYRGLVKKMLVPVSCAAPLHKDTPIFQDDREVGLCRSSVTLDDGRYLALAMLRLDALKTNISNQIEFVSNTQPVKLELPSWYESDVFDDTSS